MNYDASYIKSAREMANNTSTCLRKVIGCCYVTELQDGSKSISYSSNIGTDYNCREKGTCLKYKLSGINEQCSETNHLCAALHSEIRLIEILKKYSISPSTGILYLTECPDAACANNISQFGFKQIVYGGNREIHESVKSIFNKSNIEYIHVPIKEEC